MDRFVGPGKQASGKKTCTNGLETGPKNFISLTNSWGWEERLEVGGVGVWGKPVKIANVNDFPDLVELLPEVKHEESIFKLPLFLPLPDHFVFQLEYCDF